MSRVLKNILMVFAVVLLIATSIFTVYHAQNHSSKGDENVMQNNGGNMPNMQGGDISGGNIPSGNIPSGNIPSGDMPSGDMPSGDMPSGDMPSGDVPSADVPSGMENGDSNNMEEPPAKPDGETTSNTDNSSNANGLSEMQNNSNNMGMMPTNNQNQNNVSNISIIYYVLFGVPSLALALLVMYLIMSRFNKKTLKETFFSRDKVTIYILSIIIVTFGLLFAEITTTKYLISGNMSNSMGENNMGFGSMGDSEISYQGATEITEDAQITSGEYTSSTIDENSILVSGSINSTIENITVTKTGDSDGGDTISFYGINSAILAKSGANLILNKLTISTSATGANGVFSYGGSATTNNTSSDGTTINISDSTITTTGDNSGGIMTTGGGTTNAFNLIINTSGISSAAIRSDRGGGTINVDGGTYTTSGSGSPAIYSTAKIIVKNATLVSNVSEGIVVEGANSVEISDCDLTDSNTKLNGLSTTYKNIFLYQSMSGDASAGTASFTAKDSKITTNNGDTFYVTNTTAVIDLTNNTITNNDSEGNFLRVKADSWGNSGSNGGDVTLTLTNQTAVGNIVIDNVSSLKMTMKSDSYYEGKINADNTAKSITLTLDETSKIKLTGYSYVTSLDNAVADNSNIDFNGYKLYVNGEAIN